jgi:hypothetical protein
MDNLFTRVSQYLDIDSRVKLKIPPRKLSPQVISNFSSKFPRPQVVYLMNSHKLINFVMASVGKHIIISNIDFVGKYHDYFWFHSEDMNYEVVSPDSFYASTTPEKHWVTELKPKIVM